MTDQCRICRKSTLNTYAKKLFETERSLWLLQIELITGEWLNYEQGWPCNICIRCEDELSIAAAFRERCIQTQEELRLELGTGEAKPDHLDPLNISQNVKGSIINHHLKEELIIKDEDLDDENSGLVFECNSVKQNEELVMQEEEGLEKQLESCIDKISEIITNDKVNEVQQFQTATIPQTLEVVLSSKKNKNSRLKRSLIINKQTKKRPRAKRRKNTLYTCENCGKRFMSKYYLNRHSYTNKCKKGYECSICKKQLSSSQTLKDHELMHTGVQNNHLDPLNIAQNDKKSSINHHFEDELIIKDEHLDDENPIFIFDCNSDKAPAESVGCHEENEIQKMQNEKVLQKQIKSCIVKISKIKTNIKVNQIQISQLDTHLKETNPEKATIGFKCDRCKRYLKSEKTIKNHLRRNTCKTSLECNICKQLFATKHSLMKHELIHMCTRNYHCEVCDESFRFAIILKQHLLSKKHKSKAASMVDKHLMEKNSEINEENFICDICGKQFPNKRAFMDHFRRHTDTKDLECNICKKRFALQPELQRHLDSVHAGIKRFCCKYCGMKFKYTQTKTYHERAVHTFQYPFKCRYCEKAFITGYKRKAHELVHSNIRKFYCELCDAYFKQYTGYHNHINTRKHKRKEKEGKNKQN